MIKLPMLLSKPKKDYRSVSKTDLLKEQQEQHLDSTAGGSGDFYEYDEIKAANEERCDEGVGSLCASIQYDHENCCLIVTIEKFTDKMFFRESDSEVGREQRSVFISFSITPDTQHSGKTNPVETSSDTAEINQQLVFNNIHYNRFQILCLHFKVVIDQNVVGEASQDISKIDKTENFSNPVTLNLNINPAIKQECCEGSGELLMSLCYQPAAKRLSVVVLKARNVPKMDITGFSDPYVKIYLHHQNFRSSKKKTHIKKRSLNPVFNESFIFDLPSKDGSLDEVYLEVIMCDWDRITKNEVIGRIVLGGPECEGTALTHWEEIQKNPRRPIAQWHKLTGPQ